MQFTILEGLYLVIIFCLLLFTIFFIVFVLEATKVMRDVKKITSIVEQVMSSMSEIPVMLAHKVMEKMRGKKRE